MQPRAYFNDFEAYAAQWLRNLMFAGHLMKGEVDARSIEEVKSRDLEGFTRAHFFAGIGVWDVAMSEAGWPVGLNAWSASLPCQPWSVAGEGKGEDDERHLWPVFRRLYLERRPAIIVGEQVSSPDGLRWLDTVHNELEADGYAVGALVAAAASVGAPHARHRTYWFAVDLEQLEHTARLFMAYADREELDGFERIARENGESGRGGSSDRGAVDAVADAEGERRALGDGVESDRPRRRKGSRGRAERHGEARAMADDNGSRRAEFSSTRPHGGGERGHDVDGRGAHDGAVAHADSDRSGRHAGTAIGAEGEDGFEGDLDREDGLESLASGSIGGAGSEPLGEPDGEPDGERSQRLAEPSDELGQPGRNGARSIRPDATAGFWSPCDWVDCRDGKRRPIEPGTFPLVDGVVARVGQLRAYGNACVRPLATTFLRCVRHAVIELALALEASR